jgi:hypothetical protein
MKQTSLFAMVFVTSFAWAKEPIKTEEVLVTITPANVCYKADVVVGTPNGDVLQGISSQVPCGDKPARVLPLLAFKKEGEQCTYFLGKALQRSRGHYANNMHHFQLIARCPTGQK